MRLQKHLDAIILVIISLVLLLIFSPSILSLFDYYIAGAIAGAPLTIYPHAANVVIRRGNNERITTFQTSDSSQDILTFYESELQKKGWSGWKDGDPAISITYNHLIEDTAHYGYSDVYRTTVTVSSANGLNHGVVIETHNNGIIDHFGPGLNP